MLVRRGTRSSGYRQPQLAGFKTKLQQMNFDITVQPLWHGCHDMGKLLLMA
jgi:hypothetical protein